MLQMLAINNFLLIDNIELELKPGLTVVTGETGAGKSIILDALLLVLGSRASGKIIKDIAKPAVLSASFTLPQNCVIIAKLDELGIDTREELILRRVFGVDGKTKAYINDTPVGIALLADLREYLLEICGQHDSRGLLDSTTHLHLLDVFNDHSDNLVTLKKHYQGYTHLKKELADLREKSSKADFEMQYLQTVVEELQTLDVKLNEEEKLADERKALLDSVKAQDAFSKAQEIMDSNLLTQLYALEKELIRFPEIFAEPLSLVKTATIELEETQASLKALATRFNPDDTTMEGIETRLFKIRSAARKYGITPAQLPDFLTQKQTELANFTDINNVILQTEKQFVQAYDLYFSLAQKVSKTRHSTAEKLRKAVLSELKELKMDKADFEVEIISSPQEPSFAATGFDNVRFLVCTNPGSPYGQLDKIASGGELSRIMLALKVAMANVKSVPVLIFDEIDTGISGAVSDAVGKKLALLANDYQVLVVTHQPQVAAYGHNHLLVAKQSSSKTTKISVAELDVASKNQEIARMLSGDALTDESLAAAKRLIQSAA